MKKIIFILILISTIAAAHAGNIIGTVRAQGKISSDSSGAEDHYDSRAYKFAEKVDYDDMRDFVVYIEGAVGTNAAPPQKTLAVTTSRIAQHGATFQPHVLPVVVGTTVEWPNDDTIYHNVFSDSEAKQFDLGLYKGNPPEKRITFDKAGRVDVFCSIHANMNCVVLVLQNPYFAVTDARGRFSITNVPAGTYKLKAWHERLPPQTREIVVPEKGDVKTDFVLGITGLPRY
jgi:plastocyanin